MVSPDKTFVYEQVVQKILRYVEENSIRVGDKLPGEREMAQRFGCSPLTVRKAAALLVGQHILSRSHGSGTYLMSPVDQLRTQRPERIEFLPNNLIGVFAQFNQDTFNHRILELLVAAAERRNMELAIIPIHDFSESILVLPGRLEKQGCRALIIPALPVQQQNCLEQFMNLIRIPVVFSASPGYFPGANCEAPDDAGLFSRRDIRFACRYLEELGYPSVVFVSPEFPSLHPNTLKNREFDAWAATTRCRSLRYVLPRDFSGREALVAALKKLPRPIGVIAVDDDYACRLMTTFFRAKLRIPEDVALLGCNDDETAQYAEVPLSSLKFPFEHLVDMLLDEAEARIAQRPHLRPVPPMPIPVIRDSCGGRKLLGPARVEALLTKLQSEIADQVKP